MKQNLISLSIILLSLSTFSQNTTDICSCDLLEVNATSDSLVIDLGYKIEDSFNELDITGFKNAFNTEAFSNEILKRANTDSSEDKYASNFIKGIIKASDQLPKKIISEIENESYYNFINYEYNIVEKAYYITFRIYSSETGINYHDYKICSDSKRIMFNDIYIYLLGEHLSEMYARLLITSTPTNKPTTSLFKGDNNELLKVVSAYQLMEKGKMQMAYDKLSELKGKLSKEKFILIIKSMIAANINDTLYEEALFEFASIFPKDPTLYLKQIDYYILKENYNKSLELVDKLEFETEDDFLNLIKGNICLLAGKNDLAEHYFYYMTENYPNLLEGYVGYIISLSKQIKFTEALKIIEKLIDEDEYDEKEFISFLEEKDEEGNNELDVLIQSEDYIKWKQSRE